MAQGHNQHRDQPRELGGGWCYDEAGRLQRRRPVVEVLAEHCYGGAQVDRPFTRLTERRAYHDGGVFIANVDGHLADGEVVSLSHHADDYRLKLIPMDAVCRGIKARLEAVRAA